MRDNFLQRRNVITLLAGAAAAGLASLAAPALAAGKQISILHSGFPDRTPIHILIEALRALDYENGGAAAVEVLGGEGDSKRLQELVAGLVVKKPDVIIALTSPAALALKQAGVATPVVFAFVADPIELGLVVNLAHPGGNFTGVSFSGATLGGKRLDLLLEAPVEEPTQFTLCINLTTAKALGLAVPPQLIARADKVIE